MVLRIGDNYLVCRARNLSMDGVLAESLAGDPKNLNVGDKGICCLEYQEEYFEAGCRIARLSGTEIALSFLDIQKSQKSFLKKLITAC